ncbi:MAG: RNA polymerase sigma factor [Actinomycetota bacterium]|nr:RNA polymerase sigma factor [Actinomycetota bacterium]
MSDGTFRERQEHELTPLTDEQLIDYMRKARAAGRGDAVTLALRILVFGYLEIIQRRVALKVPPEDVEEVAARAMESALKGAFDEESVGQFRSWLNTITSRRIADYHRDREGDPSFNPLPDEHEGDDDFWAQVAGQEFEGVAVDAERAIQTAYGELGAEHQAIVDLYVFADLLAAEVAQRQSTSEANVHQVASRFRKRLKQLLDEGDNSG